MDLWLALSYALAIFVVGSLPGAPPVAREFSDKLQHCIGFALFTWLWCRALRKLRPRWSTRAIGMHAFFTSVGLGAALELWQGLLTWRTCELLDWVADSVGAALALGIYWGVGALRGPRPRPAA